MYYNKDSETIIKELSSNAINGLDESNVTKHQAQYGPNQLQGEKKQSIIVKFLLQFKDPLIILLLLAAVISIVVDPNEWVDSLIILIVVIINAVLGVYQENNAEKSLEALNKLS